MLGATGSVGRNALDVISRFPRRFRATALCAGTNARALAALARLFRPDVVCLSEGNGADLRKELPRGTRLLFGEEGMREAACAGNVDIVLAAASGVSSIRPVISAAEKGKRIALANKELLVMAGKFVTAAARRGKAEILPVDSEHSAVFQAIAGRGRDEILRILLTASGGPFRTHTVARMRSATVAQALGHPTWRMGAKISVDSATLMNKGLEVIEARWLFDIEPARIDIVVHPESIVHSMVEFVDGSLIAQLSTPDMCLPIQYALTYPNRVRSDRVQTDLAKLGSLTFEEPDEERFPSLTLARRAGEAGGTLPAVLNAANEVAVDAFVNRQINFLQITETVCRTMERHQVVAHPTLGQILEADARIRAAAQPKPRRFDIAPAK